MILGSEMWVKESGVAKAASQIQSLAQELPYAAGLAIKKKKRNSHCGSVAKEPDRVSMKMQV